MDPADDVTAGAPADVWLVPPTGWGRTASHEAAARLDTLDGITLGLLANGKANGAELLDLVADELASQFAIARIVRHTKPHPSLPATEAVTAMFAEHAHAVLMAVGD